MFQINRLSSVYPSVDQLLLEMEITLSDEEEDQHWDQDDEDMDPRDEQENADDEGSDKVTIIFYNCTRVG